MKRSSPSRGALLLEGVLVLLLTSGLVFAAMNRASSTGVLLDVADSQVAMLVDNWSGEVRADDTPGYRTLWPWLQDAFVLDKSPVDYVMTENEWVNHNRVPRLAVRAADGSTFWFREVTVQYAIRPDRAWTVVTDAGAEYAWHHGMMDSFARSILRDEFGRFTAEEIVRAENLRAATSSSRDRLNVALEPHGLVVLELLTTKPGFAKEYESVVQRRKVADQEIASFVQELEQLQASREARLAKLEREMQLAETQMRATQAQKLAAARREAMRDRAQTDRAYLARVRAGEEKRDQMTSKANADREQYTLEAEGFREQTDALAAEGVLAVRKALVESLKRVEFEITPFEKVAGKLGPEF